MRDNKFLKKQSDLEKRRVLEEGKNQNYAVMLEQVESVPQEQSFWKRNSKWFISAASVAASAIILVCVFAFHPFSDNSVVYSEDNFEIRNSSIEEMDADMKEFAFDIDVSDLGVSVNKTVDKISGDTIFYTVKTSAVSQIKLTFIAVCNPNYTYRDFEINDDFTSVALADYSVTYMQTFLPSGEITQLSARAKIQKKKEIVYLTEYQEYLLGAQRTILDVIQEMFIGI